MSNPDVEKKILTTATMMILSQLVGRSDGEVCRGGMFYNVPSCVLPFGFLPEIMWGKQGEVYFFYFVPKNKEVQRC